MPLGSKRESIKVSRFWSDHLKDPGIGNKSFQKNSPTEFVA